MSPNDRLIDTTILVDRLRGQAAAMTWVNSISPQDRWVSVMLNTKHVASFPGLRIERPY